MSEPLDKLDPEMLKTWAADMAESAQHFRASMERLIARTGAARDILARIRTGQPGERDPDAWKRLR